MEQHWLDNAGYHACKQSLNKQFKRDSQRSAFLVLLQVKCLWHNAVCLGGSVAHPLIGRYISRLKIIVSYLKIFVEYSELYVIFAFG